MAEKEIGAREWLDESYRKKSIKHEQPHDHVPLISIELTQDQINTIVCALSTKLLHAADERTRTIMDGENMLIASILNADRYYIQLKRIHENL